MSRHLLNISKLGDLCNISGQPVLVSSHPPSSWVSWSLNGAFCVSVFAHCLFICHWAPLEGAGSILCTASFQVSEYHRQDFLWPFSPGWKVSSLFPYRREILQPLNHIHGPLLDLSCSFISLLCWWAQTEHRTPAVASPVLNKRQKAPPSTMWQPRLSLSFNTKLIKNLRAVWSVLHKCLDYAAFYSCIYVKRTGRLLQCKLLEVWT